MSIMSPSESPQSLFPAPGRLSVTRINKRAICIALFIFGGAAIALLMTIKGRGGVSQPLGSAGEQQQTKAALASPPELKGAIEAKAKAGQAPLFSLTRREDGAEKKAQLDPEILKENEEYAKEIRRYEHQQHMQRLTRADLALSSAMESRGASAPVYAREEGAFTSPSDEGASAVVANGSMPSVSPEVSGYGQSNDPNMQGRKERFYSQGQAASYLPYRKEAALSPFEIKQGTVIPGIMITGINSDLPGQIIGQVSQNVFDSVSGKSLLIPQGTKIVGSYDSFVAVGQERAMVAWRRLIFPDGMSIELINMPGADQGGYSGLNDQVNNHYMKIFGSAIMLSLVSAGYQISQPQSGGNFPSNQDIIAAEVGRQFSQVSGELIRRNMQIQPTIEIRPGYRFNIMVNKDMILEPYAEGGL